MLARPIANLACCGSSASSQLSRCEPGKVARMLCRRRMMQKFGGKSFHDPIHIVNAKLAFLDEEPISWRFALEERHGSFDSQNSPNEGTNQQRDDPEMGNQKCNVMFAPGPTRKRGAGKVRAEQNNPEIEPRRSVNVGACNLR